MAFLFAGAAFWVGTTVVHRWLARRDRALLCIAHRFARAGANVEPLCFPLTAASRAEVWSSYLVWLHLRINPRGEDCTCWRIHG